MTIVGVAAAMALGPGEAISAPAPVKVYVHSNGAIDADGLSVDAGVIDARFARAAAEHRSVMLYQGDLDRSPTPAVGKIEMGVVKLIAKHRLSICFATDATFSGCRNLRGGG